MENVYNINKLDKQYFLYAKGWYMKNNLWYDLAIIHSKKYLVDMQYICVEDIVNKMTSIAIDVLIKTQQQYGDIRLRDKITSFVCQLHPSEYWKVSGNCYEKYDFNTSLVRNVMSIMAHTMVDGLDPKKDCDFNILPKRKK